MATIQQLKTQIQNANALGRTNLAEKGVELSAGATTYDIMQAIAKISGGGGIEYTSIVYNTDNTVTLTDKDGAVYTMECEYTEGKLTSVKYNGKAVKLTYNGDVLSKIGKTAVDVVNAKTSPRPKDIEPVGLFANDIIVPTVTITSELKNNNIKVVGLSVTDKE